MPIDAFEHLNIRSADVEALREFYEHVVGLSVGPRPAFASKGYWMYLNGQPVMHLVQRQASETAKTDSGNVDHVAFRGRDLDATKAAFRARGVTFRENVAPDNSVQIFIHDPDGLKIELNFSQ